MKNYLYLLVLLISTSTFFSCETFNELPFEFEVKILNSLYEEIIALAESVECTNPDDWALTPIGSKPCGGPKSYLAYPRSIDTVSFLEKVEAYKMAQFNFNIKHGLASDCALEQEPSGIICENGKAVLVY